MANPTPGTVIGAYRIDGVIGAGSMGDVFRAVDVGLNRRVAVKLLSEKHKDSNELRARFTREGRAVAAISHPNVVQVFATGTYQDRPYIAMELLEGTDLASAVDAQGPLPALDAARAILDAARGLDAAARAGLIHRDVKPSNLVLLVDGQVKVTDFGLAKPVDPGSEPALTALGVVVGTPDYIAPEQARGEAIDERVDIYALGGTLYFLLCGVPPFRTGVPAEDKYLKVVARHLKNPPPDARDRNPAADPELADLARALMAKKPAERPDYPTLIARLEAVVARLSGGGVRPATIPPATDGSAGRLARTPFVGGDAPHGFADDAAATRTRDPEPGLRRALAPRRGLPGWLVARDRGRGAHLRRRARRPPHPRRAAGAAPPGPGGEPVTAIDAGPPSVDAAPPPPPPTPPAGMVLVTRADGAPGSSSTPVRSPPPSTPRSSPTSSRRARPPPTSRW
ncbi:MAG: serine/threonine protein kinase [Kofleriaceae bacterium]|nr:serine/threonine protein kinase [Kofleriaceae bacterium]